MADNSETGSSATVPQQSIQDRPLRRPTVISSQSNSRLCWQALNFKAFMNGHTVLGRPMRMDIASRRSKRIEPDNDSTDARDGSISCSLIVSDDKCFVYKGSMVQICVVRMHTMDANKHEIYGSGICANGLCSNVGIKYCAHCKVHWYCCRECHEAHHPKHQIDCARLRVSNFCDQLAEHWDSLTKLPKVDYIQPLMPVARSGEVTVRYYCDGMGLDPSISQNIVYPAQHEINRHGLSRCSMGLAIHESLNELLWWDNDYLHRTTAEGGFHDGHGEIVLRKVHTFEKVCFTSLSDSFYRLINTDNYSDEYDVIITKIKEQYPGRMEDEGWTTSSSLERDDASLTSRSRSQSDMTNARRVDESPNSSGYTSGDTVVISDDTRIWNETRLTPDGFSA